MGQHRGGAVHGPRGTRARHAAAHERGVVPGAAWQRSSACRSTTCQSHATQSSRSLAVLPGTALEHSPRHQRLCARDGLRARCLQSVLHPLHFCPRHATTSRTCQKMPKRRDPHRCTGIRIDAPGSASMHLDPYRCTGIRIDARDPHRCLRSINSSVSSRFFLRG